MVSRLKLGPPTPATTAKSRKAGHGHDDDRRDGEQRLEIAVHVGVPPGDTPRRLLRLTRDPVGDLVEDAVSDLRWPLGEPVVENPFDVAITGHAERPPTTVSRASASRAARMARWALKSRERGPGRDAERFGDLGRA